MWVEDGWGDHAGKHRDLGFEAGFVGCGKGGEVTGEDGVPAGVCGIGEGGYLLGGDVSAFDYGASWLARLHRDHDEVLLKEAEGHLVISALDLLWPEVVVIIVAAEAGDADADGVLSSGDVTAFALGVVLEAEDETGKGLGIHLGETDGPDLLDHLAGRGAQATAVADFEGGFKADGDGPTGVVLGDIGLVNPGASQIKPCWNA